MYVCRKQINDVIDSSDEEAVAAERVRIEAEKTAAEEAIKP